MTDKEIIKALEDNEIIKALDCCQKEDCCGCSYFHKEECTNFLTKDALNLINRQKAEIERLENLERNVYETVDELRNKIKAEAVKEFAERLKEKERPAFPLAMVIDVYEIDNLVKEMVGENNAPCN